MLYNESVWSSLGAAACGLCHPGGNLLILTQGRDTGRKQPLSNLVSGEELHSIGVFRLWYRDIL